MTLAGNLAGALFALTSALVWGAGDFTGGYATRKSNQYVDPGKIFTPLIIARIMTFGVGLLLVAF